MENRYGQENVGGLTQGPIGLLADFLGGVVAVGHTWSDFLRRPQSGRASPLYWEEQSLLGLSALIAHGKLLSRASPSGLTWGDR
jgi:hypothetical protein